MNILGIWDGHDSGAALLMDGQLICAVNEERFTRRKLEVHFPQQAIAHCLNQGGITPDAIDQIGCATFDPAKTVTRLWPHSKERYYQIRRRLARPSAVNQWTKWIKYHLTESAGNPITYWLSSHALTKQLKASGFKRPNLQLLDHHLCHAASGAYFSGLNPALVITLDGVGDGVSGSISWFENQQLQRLATLPAIHSLGIFFEHVTNLLHMRELEDEGKVMALANFSYPIADKDNPLLNFFEVKGLKIDGRYHANALYRQLARVLWHHTPEQFAAMAQRTLENKVLALVGNALAQTRADQVVLAGGLFANVKLNGLIRNLPAITACYVAPHMGDGGLALGAAIQLDPESHQRLPNLFLGPEYTQAEILRTLKQTQLSYYQPDNLIEKTATLLVSGQVIGWFQGRMEYGPRALGGRSVLALPGLANIRDEINLKLKKRAWYQPFCPSMLDEEAERLLIDYTPGQPNRFMTSIYQVRPEFRSQLSGVIGRDGSCRPQMVAKDSTPFAQLLMAIQKKTGFGVLLNTSFNAHGAPIACSPEDALSAFTTMGIDHLILGNWMVKKGKN